MFFMKVLLQNIISEKFLSDNETWVSDIESARAFRSSADAVARCMTRPDELMQVRFHFENSRYDFCVLVVSAICGTRV